MKKQIITLWLLLPVVMILVTGCADLKENLSTPAEINVHGEGILNPASNNFHGKIIAANNNVLKDCQTCHATNFRGGTTGSSCLTCHKHGTGIQDTSSTDFHGKVIASHGWSMKDCQACHGTDFSGGITKSSCNTCHNRNNGPKACNTCHGDFVNRTSIAPPQALNGATSTSYRGVGAHQLHLAAGMSGFTVSCSSCHPSLAGYDDPKHIDKTPFATIEFADTLLKLNPAMNYSFANISCNNSWCHGGFVFRKADANPAYAFAYTDSVMTGLNPSVIWNKVDGSQGTCGTSCHALPPAGHMPSSLTGCANCHGAVIDNTGKIINQEKHINGKSNLFGQ